MKIYFDTIALIVSTLMRKVGSGEIGIDVRR